MFVLQTSEVGTFVPFRAGSLSSMFSCIGVNLAISENSWT
jgi:hypothetical protein